MTDLREQDGRKVRIKVGRKHYTLRTCLEEDQLYRVEQMVQSTVDSIEGAVGQEERLLVALLKFAYLTDCFEQRLKEAVPEETR